MPGGKDLAAAMVSNAIIEATAGIPTILHSSGDCPAPPRNISVPGRLGGDIEFLMGAYLVVAGPGTTISISNNWYDKDFCWRPDVDVDFGMPKGVSIRTSVYTWERYYTKSSIMLDVAASTAIVMLL